MCVCVYGRRTGVKWKNLSRGQHVFLLFKTIVFVSSQSVFIVIEEHARYLRIEVLGGFYAIRCRIRAFHMTSIVIF